MAGRQTRLLVERDERLGARHPTPIAPLLLLPAVAAAAAVAGEDSGGGSGSGSGRLWWWRRAAAPFAARPGRAVHFELVYQCL